MSFRRSAAQCRLHIGWKSSVRSMLQLSAVDDREGATRPNVALTRCHPCGAPRHGRSGCQGGRCQVCQSHLLQRKSAVGPWRWHVASGTPVSQPSDVESRPITATHRDYSAQLRIAHRLSEVTAESLTKLDRWVSDRYLPLSLSVSQQSVRNLDRGTLGPSDI